MDSIEGCDVRTGFQTMRDGADDLNPCDFGAVMRQIARHSSAD